MNWPWPLYRKRPPATPEVSLGLGLGLRLALGLAIATPAVCTLRGAVASRVYSIGLRVRVRVGGAVQPPVGPVFVLSLCGMPERKGCD